MGTLNLDVPVLQLRQGLQRVLDSVAACLHALNDAPERPIPLPPDFLGMMFVSPPGAELIPGASNTPQLAPPDPNRAQTARTWIVRSAVRDALSALELSLDSYFILAAHIAVTQRRANAPVAPSALQAQEAEVDAMLTKFRKTRGLEARMDMICTTLPFHPPPADLTQRQKDTMTVAEARHCLEHRGGVVDAKALKGSSELTVRWRAFRVTAFDAAGVEREAKVGEYVEKMRVQQDAVHEKKFALGQRVFFTASELGGICQSLDKLGIAMHAHLLGAAVVAGIGLEPVQGSK